LGQQECFADVRPRVTQFMNEGLTRPFTHDEVDRALAQMPSLKAPGPDGFGVCFFSHHWDTVGGAITGAVLDFLNRGNFDLAINSTYISLIPKVAPVSSVNDFRPISLCNVFYKLISKFSRTGSKWYCPQSSPKIKVLSF
jgi:hypothetical protein